MAQAIVNPEDVRHFASALAEFNADIRDKMAALKGGFAALGDTWRDQEHAKFTDEFDKTIETLNHFHDVVEDHVPFLLRKAEAAQEYLDRR
jgi:uncharacterized protein YukE